MPRRLVNRPQRLLAALLSALFSWSVAAVANINADSDKHWQNKRYIEGAFSDIALNSEFEKVRPVIRKWQQPLRIWVNSTAGDADQQRWLIAMQFLQLGEITGLPVIFVEHKEQSNVRIFFAADRDVHRIVADEMSPTASKQIDASMCLSQIRFNRWAQITRGTVVIPVERAKEQGKLVPCVIEEVTQMLGLINDSKRFYPTVFSDITDDDFLTGMDYVLLRLLYLPQLRSGMTQAQVAPIIRHHLDMWERDGMISHANSLIAGGPLYAAFEGR